MTLIERKTKIKLGKNEKLLLRFIGNRFGVSTIQLHRKSGLYIGSVRETLRRLRKRNLIFSVSNYNDIDGHPQILMWYRNG